MPLQRAYRAQPGGGTLHVKPRNDAAVALRTAAEAAGDAFYELDVPQGASTLSLWTDGAGPVTIFGVVMETEGRACMRLYKRKDGTVLTSDCPVGLAEKAWKRARNTALASVALVLTMFAGLLTFFGRSTCEVEQTMGKIEVIQNDGYVPQPPGAR